MHPFSKAREIAFRARLNIKHEPRRDRDPPPHTPENKEQSPPPPPTPPPPPPPPPNKTPPPPPPQKQTTRYPPKNLDASGPAATWMRRWSNHPLVVTKDYLCWR